MERVAGIPTDTLTLALVLLLGLSLAVIVALGIRNHVFVKMGVRNIGRRRGRTALIVVGLMLATAIIATALGTGDTMSATIRSSVYERLGGTDEVVAVKAAKLNSPYFATTDVKPTYFDEAFVADVAAVAATRPDLIDGVAPAIVESVAVQDRTQRSSEPRFTLFATSTDAPPAFSAMRGSDGSDVSLGDLGTNEVYLNRDGADALDAQPGDELALYVGGQLVNVRVRDVVDHRGSGTAGSAVIIGLRAAQTLVDHFGQVRYALVSNAGGETTGVAKTDEVKALLDPAVADHGLEASPIKQDGIDVADATGNAFMQMFTTFGSFSIIAGIMLIFLIFVMLAAERRGEMGVARAVGTQRGHLVQSFLFEGAAYDLIAAAVGAAIGIAVSYAMVLAVGSLFARSTFHVVFAVQTRSFVLAYCLGVLLTLVVVAASSWRVSRLNIVTAIRNMPDPIGRPRRRTSVLRAVVPIAVGALLAVAGQQGKQAMPFLLGVSLVLIGCALASRLVGVSDRVAYTVAGLALVVWWLLPFRVYEALVPDLSMDFSVWVVGGVMVVLGASWTVMNNADALLGIGARVIGRVRSLTPVMRISMAYPLRNRLRTGMTLAMFTLVVFTLVVGATTSRSFILAVDDVQRFGGGFDVRATTPPVSAVTDMPAALSTVDGVAPGDVQVVASQSSLGVEARQSDTGRDYADYLVHGVDDSFLNNTTYGFAARATGYETDEEIWQALHDTSGLAVVDSTVVPRRQNWGFGDTPDFALSGFWLDDGTFSPVPVEVRDPLSGKVIPLTIIGVVRSDTPIELTGLMTSQRTLAPLGDRVAPTTHYLKLAPGVDASAFAKSLESSFLANGMQAETFRSILDEAVGSSLTFDWLILGFMGLGLIVGIAALGVISARSVVERRQQIGVLRSIGFQRSMVQLGFLAESTFIALTAIVLGTGLGLAMAWNVIDDANRKADWAAVTFQTPWAILAAVFVGVLVAALVTTLLPARHASRVLPAEALRYQ